MATALDISASGLVAQRIRLNTIANNLANVSTTRNAQGEPEPYVRKLVIFQTGAPDQKSDQGVHVSAIVEDDPTTMGTEPFRLEYRPGHPDANPLGYVQLPNIDPAREFVDALEAGRAYEANIQAIEIYKSMGNNISRLLE